MLNVVVPQGVHAGQSFLAQTPTGPMSIVVPQGSGPGQQITFSVAPPSISVVGAVQVHPEPISVVGAVQVHPGPISVVGAVRVDPEPIPPVGTSTGMQIASNTTPEMDALVNSTRVAVNWLLVPSVLGLFIFPGGTLGFSTAVGFLCCPSTKLAQAKMSLWLHNMAVATAVFCALGSCLSGGIGFAALAQVSTCQAASGYSGSCDGYNPSPLAQSPLVPNDDTCAPNSAETDGLMGAAGNGSPEKHLANWWQGAHSGWCDDGAQSWREGDRMFCACGTDISDCGPRSERDCCESWASACAELSVGGGIAVFLFFLQGFMCVAACIAAHRAARLKALANANRIHTNGCHCCC